MSMLVGNNRSSITPVTKQHVFSRVPKNEAIEYSTFDRSHRALGTLDAGFLYPLLVDEVYPGDIYKTQGSHLLRMLTPIHPFMDGLVASVEYFYCPTRLVWNNFKAFMGERKRNDQKSISEEYQVPMLNSGATGVSVNSIFDVAGIPSGIKNVEFSSLPFRAMNLIYNEWYRDENLCDWLNVGGTTGSDGEYDIDTEFGDSDSLNNYKLFKRAKRHDYFTSALPFQQKGTPQSLSIGVSAPVVGDGNAIGLTDGNFNYGLQCGIPGNQPYYSYPLATSQDRYGSSAGTGYDGNQGAAASGTTIGLTTDGTKSGMFADLQNVTGFTINDLRIAIQLQALKELDARGGTRYKEIIKSHFNVTVSDATLDRPEYLGGYYIPFSVIPVANTSGNSSDPQGNLAAYAQTPAGQRFGFQKAFEEHGYVIGFLSIRSTQTYQQGLERMWSRKNKYDFYDPMLANISEQAIKQKEILLQDGDIIGASGEPVNEETFGYQEAWAELRYKPNRCFGLMRTYVDQSLKYWHLAQQFSPYVDDDGINHGIPLNQDFIEENVPVNRVLAVQAGDDTNVDGIMDAPSATRSQFFGDSWFDLKCTREIPLYSVPAFLLGRL